MYKIIQNQYRKTSLKENFKDRLFVVSISFILPYHLDIMFAFEGGGPQEGLYIEVQLYIRIHYRPHMMNKNNAFNATSRVLHFLGNRLDIGCYCKALVGN